MGNGAKAQQKRERNAKAAGNKATSQLGSNSKAMTVQCNICKQVFMSTTKAPALIQHAENKHSKTLPDCFPDFTA